MEERTDPRIGRCRRGGNVRNLPLRRILTTTRPFGFSKEPLRQGTLPFASRNPMPRVPQPMGLVRRRTGTGPTRSRSAVIKPSSSTSTSPRLVQTLLPVSLQVQRGVQKSFAALQKQEPRPDEREHFPLQEQVIIHTQPLRNLG